MRNLIVHPLRKNWWRGTCRLYFLLIFAQRPLTHKVQLCGAVSIVHGSLLGLNRSTMLHIVFVVGFVLSPAGEVEGAFVVSPDPPAFAFFVVRTNPVEVIRLVLVRVLDDFVEFSLAAVTRQIATLVLAEGMGIVPVHGRVNMD